MVTRWPDTNIYVPISTSSFSCTLPLSLSLSTAHIHLHIPHAFFHTQHSCKPVKQLFSSSHCCPILFRDCHCPGDKEAIITLGPQGNKRAISQPWLKGGMWAPGLLMSPWETLWDRVALLPGYHYGNPSVHQRLQGKVQKSRPRGGQKGASSLMAAVRRWQRVFWANLTWETNVSQGSPFLQD